MHGFQVSPIDQGFFHSGCRRMKDDFIFDVEGVQCIEYFLVFFIHSKRNKKSLNTCRVKAFRVLLSEWFHFKLLEFYRSVCYSVSVQSAKKILVSLVPLLFLLLEKTNFLPSNENIGKASKVLSKVICLRLVPSRLIIKMLN